MFFNWFPGSVDAVAVTVSGVSESSRPITANTIFVFDVVNVNIRGGYDSTTGTYFTNIFNWKFFQKIFSARVADPRYCSSPIIWSTLPKTCMKMKISPVQSTKIR